MEIKKVSNQEVSVVSLVPEADQKENRKVVEVNQPFKLARSSRSLLRQARYETQNIRNQVNQLYEMDQEITRARLLELGFDVLKITNGGDTVLHQACRKKNFEAVELALCYGFNPHQINKAGDTPLHIAAEKGSIPICQRLIDAGADIFAKNQLNQAPIHKALAHGQSLLIGFFESKGYLFDKGLHNYLIAEGFNPDHVDNAGNTVIHRIVKSNNLMLMKEVIKAGYKLECMEAQNKNGETPFILAIKNKNHLMLQLLLESRDVSKVPLRELAMAASLGWSEGLKLLMDRAPKEIVDLTFATEQGNCKLLHYACYSGDLKTVQLLVQRGADVNFITVSGYAPAVHHPIPSDWARFTMPCWGPPLVKRGGEAAVYLHPVISPLSVVKKYHPNNQQLQDYLKDQGAVEFSQIARGDALAMLTTFPNVGHNLDLH